MLKILLGSPTGILTIITVLGAIAVVAGWTIYWYTKFGREK